MKLSVSLARKLSRLGQGEVLPRSQVKSPLVDNLLEHGVLTLRSRGTQQSLYCQDSAGLHSFLRNHLGVNDLDLFIDTAGSKELLRSDAVQIASDSKLKNIRTFKGFLVNCYHPVEASLNGVPFLIDPTPGVFTYIYDYECFFPAAEATVVGVENSENFRYLERQQELFPYKKVLFVSRYPQSGDLAKWLQGIENPYVHYGDFDFAGINIYLNEFKKKLGSRAKFFVPEAIVKLFQNFGNRELYNRQVKNAPARNRLLEPGLEKLWDLIYAEKKGVEQEILVGKTSVL